MASTGICKTKISKSTDYTIVVRGENYVEFTNLATNINVFVDVECVLAGTENPTSAVENAKWILIEETVWTSLLDEYRMDSGNKTFGDLGFYEKIKPHVLKSYIGAKISIKGSDIENITAGNVYYIMPFNSYPEYKYQNHIARLVYLKEPFVRFVYVKPPKSSEADIPSGYDATLHLYGMYAEINLSTHLIPDIRKKGVIVPKNYSCKIKGNIFFLNKSKEEVVVDNFETTIEVSNRNYNSYKSTKVYIDPKWRDFDGTHQEDHQPQKYFVKIFASEIESSSYLPTISGLNSSNIFNTKVYNTNTDFQIWRSFDKEAEEWVAMDIQPHIEVRWDTMEMIFEKIEIEKNNQIQYIGDIEYEYKEYDPCGYKKIKIKSEDRQRYIFDEDQVETQKIDETSEYFAIIAGDTAKEVVITIENLQQPPNFICTGVLLKKDEQHDSWEKVFQMGNVQPAEHRSTGYQTVEDKSDPTHQNDRDVYASKTKAPSKNVASSQMLQLDVNYFKEGENGIKLKLPFKYNKTVAEGTIIRNTALDQLWLFRYFWITEDMVQKYFVPIATCRYPNQIAKIKVYPDISWTFHINYGMKNPIYYRDTWVEMRQHRVEDAVVRAQAGDVDGYDGTVETKFSLSLEAKWNGTEAAKLDQKISEKVKLLIGSFIKIKQFVDKVTGRDRGNSRDGASSSIAERMRRVPLSIEVLSPQITLGAGWEFKKGREEEGLSHRLAPTLGIVAKADPVIGAEAVIDLIAWGKKLHPGAYAVITALDLLAYAANAEVRFDLKFYGKLVIDGNVELSKLKKEGVIKAEGQFGFELYLQATATEKFNAFFTEVDVDFEAKAQAEGYFSLGLSAGMDDYKGIYFQPIIRHSGIKIILSVYVKVNGFKRTRQEEYIVIAEGKAGWDDKYYFD